MARPDAIESHHATYQYDFLNLWAYSLSVFLSHMVGLRSLRRAPPQVKARLRLLRPSPPATFAKKNDRKVRSWFAFSYLIFGQLSNYGQLYSNFQYSICSAVVQLKQLKIEFINISTDSKIALYIIIYSCISCITVIVSGFGKLEKSCLQLFSKPLMLLITFLANFKKLCHQQTFRRLPASKIQFPGYFHLRKT